MSVTLKELARYLNIIIPTYGPCFSDPFFGERIADFWNDAPGYDPLAFNALTGSAVSLLQLQPVVCES